MIPGASHLALPGVPGPGSADMTARLYGLVARSRRRAVILRRGPSKLVRLLVWELGSDTLVPGQWFKGRIYPRRCDLSPDGEHLAYFAATHRGPYGAWTAISRPPYLTALALWPKPDCWGGGGLFTQPSLFELNHRELPYLGREEFALADGFRKPPWLRVQPLGERAGWGEDSPIQDIRMRRDGWTTAWTQAQRGGRASRYGWIFDPPARFERPLERGAVLRLHLHALHERDGRHEVQTAAVLGPAGTTELGRVDWADADHNGDVLYAASGCLYRLAVGAGEARMVADLNAMGFETVAAPPEALRWARD